MNSIFSLWHHLNSRSQACGIRQRWELQGFCFISGLDATMTLGAPVPFVISSSSAIYQLLKSGRWKQEIYVPPDFCISCSSFIFLHLVCHQMPSPKLLANLQYIRSCNAEEGNRYASYFFHFHNTLRIERQFSAIPSRHGFLAFYFPCISKITIEIIIGAVWPKFQKQTNSFTIMQWSRAK